MSVVRELFYEVRWFFISLWRMFTPKRWRFDCVECEDTGWVSREAWAGWKGYRYTDHCPVCRPKRALLSAKGGET